MTAMINQLATFAHDIGDVYPIYIAGSKLPVNFLSVNVTSARPKSFVHPIIMRAWQLGGTNELTV